MTGHGWSKLPACVAMVLALLAALATVSGPPAQAVSIAVNTTDDELNSDGDCSLREAITAANTDAAVDACSAGSGADVISLPAAGVPYTLSIAGVLEDASATGDLDITDDLTITGAGATATIIDGGGIDRVFDVDPAGAGITVSFAGVTVRNGSEVSGGGILFGGGELTLADSVVSDNTTTGYGGGIYNVGGGTMALTGSTVSGNTANYGGGIDNWDGTLTLTGSTVSGNTATATGGGIASEDGTVTLTNSTVSGNTAASGGGIDSLDDTLSLTDSTVSGNTANDGAGGGITNFDSTATLTNTTVSGNTATQDGGGIHNCGTSTLTNTTVSGNDSDGAGGGIFEGCFDTLILTNVTITDNTATRGGGIAVEAATGGSATLGNTIIAGNTGDDCTGTAAITSNGHNLDSDDTCGLAAAGDLPATDPQLGSLADNGGPTQTHALPADSEAVDAGDDAACPATDQRGVGRPVDGDEDGTATCDIGAYEYEPPAAPTPTPEALPEELPPTGGAPVSGGGIPTLAVVLLAAGALGLAGVGSVLAGVRQRS